VAPRLVIRLLGWATLGVAAAAAQAWMVRRLWLVGAMWAEGAHRILASPLFSFRYLFETNAQQVVLLMLCFAVLQRVHRERRERELATQLERSLASARVHVLSLQLQPHFLFNTLNAIAALVAEDPNIAENMLVHLSNLLRLTFDADARDDVSVRTELTRVDMYVALQRMRFGDRLSVATRVDPDALDARVPAFLLQPLVENAISHGVEPRRGVGHIDIDARCLGDQLVLSVRDDGVGLPPVAGRRERVGLSGTRARLEAMFPGAHQLDLRPAEPQGTVVTVVVPRQSAVRDPGR
jgi:LytS/YehU family sensor histidine kinase